MELIIILVIAAIVAVVLIHRKKVPVSPNPPLPEDDVKPRRPIDRR